MGFNYRKRNKDGLNFSWSTKGPRVSKSVHMGPLSFNIGKTLNGKPVLRTRYNFGNGMFWTKQHTIGKEQASVNTNLSNTFGISDTTSYDSDTPWWMAWLGAIGVILCAIAPFFYERKVVPFFERITGYQMIWDSHWAYGWHWFLLTCLCVVTLACTEASREHKEEWHGIIPMFVGTIIGYPVIVVTGFFAAAGAAAGMILAILGVIMAMGWLIRFATT